jgi:hypothetical protein
MKSEETGDQIPEVLHARMPCVARLQLTHPDSSARNSATLVRLDCTAETPTLRTPPRGKAHEGRKRKGACPSIGRSLIWRSPRGYLPSLGGARSATAYQTVRTVGHAVALGPKRSSLPAPTELRILVSRVVPLSALRQSWPRSGSFSSSNPVAHIRSGCSSFVDEDRIDQDEERRRVRGNSEDPESQSPTAPSDVVQ